MLLRFIQITIFIVFFRSLSYFSESKNFFFYFLRKEKFLLMPIQRLQIDLYFLLECKIFVWVILKKRKRIKSHNAVGFWELGSYGNFMYEKLLRVMRMFKG